MSRHAPLDDATIWNAISCTEKRTRGCRWGEYTRFAVLDIDETSQYHNELGLARLRHTLAAVGLTSPQLYQSSASSGWHMYLFLSDWIETTELQETITKLLRAEGFELRLGQLEVFPSKNGLRLPLQHGFAWLDEQATILIRREDITETEAVAKFLDALDANAHNWPQTRNRIESRIEQIETAAAATTTRRELKNEAVEEDGFTAFFTKAGLLQEVYNFGRDYWETGLTEPKQRHHAILCLGHYLWYGDEDNGVRALPGIARADQRAAKIAQWLIEKHNGYSDAVKRGAWDEIEKDIQRACNWEAAEGNERKRERYPLTDRAIDRLQGLTKRTGRLWYPEDFQKGNVGREEGAREKIRAALVQLLEAGRRVSVRGIESLSGCRRETIRRHVDIWGLFRLSNGLGDLSSAPPLPCVLSVESSSVSDTSLEQVACAEVGFLNQLPAFIQEQFENEPVKSSNQPLNDFCQETVPENQSVFSLFLREVVFSIKAPILFIVFDSLRLKLFGATANNSTACETQTIAPSLPSSLATGSNTGALTAIASSAGGSSLELAVFSLNGFLPAVAGPLHLPQTGFFLVAHARALVTSRQGICCADDSFYGSSVRQSNRMWWHRNRGYADLNSCGFSVNDADSNFLAQSHCDPFKHFEGVPVIICAFKTGDYRTGCADHVCQLFLSKVCFLPKIINLLPDFQLFEFFIDHFLHLWVIADIAAVEQFDAISYFPVLQFLHNIALFQCKCAFQDHSCIALCLPTLHLFRSLGLLSLSLFRGLSPHNFDRGKNITSDN